ncbi:hypothetical protein DEO72_LG3g1141 [Vigna unguiculata]|uniref:Uncharacterized protein n=1 Tax=Vigna unguiculata TaxID=3917 RepID=A0A4D6LDF6_VIGUN|nr:hypothetical protein DEO72_LG3g1141 [Vigna unguiculata]
MTNQLKEHKKEKKTWTKNSKLLKDQIGSSLNMGFQLALDQVRMLIPDADLSQADISKTIVDGQLIETDEYDT